MPPSEMSRSLFPLLCCTAAALLLLTEAQQCNDSEMRRCRQEGLDILTGRQTTRNDINEQCRSLREHFDCVLWQTANCLDKDGQDNNRDSITRMWRYLQSFCESQGSWYTKACYQRDDIKRCESLLPSRGYTTDTSSCRSFNSFRNCVTSIAQIDCSTDDLKLLGTYIMEKGQQRAWNCPRDQNDIYPFSAPLSADTDPRYTALSETSYGYCSDEARYELQECRSQFYTSQKEAQTHNDSDMRHHKTCCAMVHYEDCVEKRLEDRCGDRSKSESRAIVSDMKQRFPYQSCGDHTMAECSGTSAVAASFILCVLVMITTKLSLFSI